MLTSWSSWTGAFKRPSSALIVSLKRLTTQTNQTIWQLISKSALSEMLHLSSSFFCLLLFAWTGTLYGIPFLLFVNDIRDALSSTFIHFHPPLPLVNRPTWWSLLFIFGFLCWSSSWQWRPKVIWSFFENSSKFENLMPPETPLV